MEARCKASRIYHAGAAAQRVETAIAETLGAPAGREAGLKVMVRIEDDLCQISLETSGELLHKRGAKQAVSKAPMRETLAALFLRACGYEGGEPVLDPMCGSGSFVLEAAEIAAGLAPGRARAFAFEQFAGHDAAAWAAMRAAATGEAPAETPARFFGSDKNAGAIAMAQANAERAGVSALTRFAVTPIAALPRPDGPPGLVIINPPYGGRIGDKARLRALYRALGETLRRRFAGWRVGLVTSEAALAKATGLPFGPPGPLVDHGGLKIRLYQTRPLKG